MIIYNKERFFSCNNEKRYFDMPNEYSVITTPQAYNMSISSPTVSSNLPFYDGYNYITIPEMQFGDYILESSLILEFDNGTFLFHKKYQAYPLYELSSTSLIDISITATADDGNKLLLLHKNYILYPDSITATCTNAYFKCVVNYTSMLFRVGLNKSQYKHLYTTNFTYYSDIYLSVDNLQYIYAKMEDDGLSPVDDGTYLIANGHNYFTPQSDNEQKMYITGIILYDSNKVPMVISSFKHPIVVSNNAGESFELRIAL